MNYILSKWLANIEDIDVKFNEPMYFHSSFKIGGPADTYIVPRNTDALVRLVKKAWEKGIEYHVIGGGTNLLIKDNGIRGMVIDLRSSCSKMHPLHKIPVFGELGGIFKLEGDNSTFIVGAGVRTAAFCAFAIKNGLEGMNFALGIPGTVGGGIKMNAGTSLGEMKDVITVVNILTPEGEILSLPASYLDFQYRRLRWNNKKMMNAECGMMKQDIHHSSFPSFIILSGQFALKNGKSPDELKHEAAQILSLRRKRQPMGVYSAGCFFKNPSDSMQAGKLIDRAGLKGRSIGGAQVSFHHANFIVNTGKATADDILALADLVRETVFKTFGIELEVEVEILGE